MNVNLQARRVLLAASASEGSPVRQLFAGAGVPGWHAIEADSFESARAVQERDPCDVVLLDSSLVGTVAPNLGWLAEPRRSPAVILSDAAPETLQAYFEQGVGHWLPRRLALAQPQLLAAVLGQAARYSDLQRQLRQREDMLVDCRRQVNHLMGMLWQTLPTEARSSWFSQRSMLERLYEEVMRSQRHGDVLTVVLADFRDGSRQPVATVTADDLAGWTARQVGKHKRRCDVAGQYGPHGFMLLLPHTSERGAVETCRRLRPLLENNADLPDGAAAPLRVSFGCATYSTATATVKSLLGRAEECLEQARQSDGAE